MELTARPRITAGFAAVTVVNASAIVTPMTVRPTALPDAQTRVVQLVDVSWDQVLQTALTKATDIYDHLSPPRSPTRNSSPPTSPSTSTAQGTSAAT